MSPTRSHLRQETINTSVFPLAVAKTDPSTLGHESKRTERYSTRLEILRLFGGVYTWSLWGFMCLLLFSQLLGVVWNSSTTYQHSMYGENPALGPNAIEGLNDNPYSDRSIACVLEGWQYKPVQLQKALMAAATTTIDTTGTFVHGYRVLARDEMTLESDSQALLVRTCDAIASTLDSIFESCAAMGYNVTKDTLRIVNGVNSSTMKLIPNALPVLIMPFWDNSKAARYAIPGWDGSACVFRLEGVYESDSDTLRYFRTTTRAVRESKTIEWLGQPGGVWRNGWYEDPTGTKWYSDVLSTKENTTYPQHLFDTAANKERNCSATEDCGSIPNFELWSSKLSSTATIQWFNSVAISNGAQYGVFLYESYLTVVVKSVYDLETLISNIALGFVMFRWLVCMAALQNGHRLRVTKWYTTGIGSISCARNFHYLPIVLLPRFKTTLAAFFTVGCRYEGDQTSLSENWFVMYPAICEFMLFYYSVLNMVAKMLRRRITETLFGPTLIFLCAMHYLRQELGRSGWFEYDGRVTTVVHSSDFEDLHLFDFFTTDVSLRLNGNITPLYVTKLVVVAINALPLIICCQNTSPKSKLGERTAPCAIEKALAVRASFVGGLGCSTIYETSKCGSGDATMTALSGYDLVRLGYVVIGGKYVLSIADWHTLFILSPARYLRQPPNFRVTLFTIVEQGDSKCNRVTIDDFPHVCRLNDPRLRSISIFDITARPFN